MSDSDFDCDYLCDCGLVMYPQAYFDVAEEWLWSYCFEPLWLGFVGTAYVVHHLAIIDGFAVESRIVFFSHAARFSGQSDKIIARLSAMMGNGGRVTPLVD